MSTLFTLISIAVLTSHVASDNITIAKAPLTEVRARVQHLSQKAPQVSKKVIKLALKAYPNPLAPKQHTMSSDIKTKMIHLSQKAPQLSKKVLTLALTAYHKARAHGAAQKPVLTVIDYSLPSSKQRMWIFDMNKERLLYHTYVAHGRNSGLDTPNRFSNQFSSKATSLGTYITKDTYMGSKGYSLNLQGLEKGFNDNAYDRRVVIHGAWYVEPDFIKRAGRAGRSWGCPSIAQTLAKPVINTIKGGSVVFAYYPDRNYLSHSGYIV